ncbi:MAG: hypothetical protein CMN28_04485 [Salinisphaeraceae bacterium]|jgi:phasin family protein|nr:hypothetical protein [Salinisphaeraceae bacterium]
MASKQNRVAKLRKDVDKLRKSYTGAMSSANSAVQDGFERLVEHELTAIKTHYEAALKNLKQLRKGGDPRDLATAQLKLLQETIDRIMNNARESLTILDETRRKISEDVRRELDATGQPAAATPAARPAPKKRAATTRRKTAGSTAARKTTARKSTATKKTAAKKTAARKPAAAKTTAAKKPSASKSAATGKKTSAARKAPAKRRAPAKKAGTASKTGTGGTSSSS